jgi:hypothetical protein
VLGVNYNDSPLSTLTWSAEKPLEILFYPNFTSQITVQQNADYLKKEIKTLVSNKTQYQPFPQVAHKIWIAVLDTSSDSTDAKINCQKYIQLM